VVVDNYEAILFAKEERQLEIQKALGFSDAPARVRKGSHHRGPNAAAVRSNARKINDAIDGFPSYTRRRKVAP
jgi:hypothetical protein